MNAQKQIIPDLMSFLNGWEEVRSSQRFCSLPGKVTSFDATTQTAQIEIMLKTIPDPYTKAIEDYPALVDVPVFQLSGGLGGVNLPPLAGDPCLVIFSDRDIDNWFATGSAQSPRTERVHSIADGFAFIGVRPLTNLTKAPDHAATSLYNHSTEISIKADLIRLKNENTDLKTILSTIISTINSNLTGISATLGTITGASFGTPYSKTEVADNTGNLFY